MAVITARLGGQRALLRFLQRLGRLSAADALRFEQVAQQNDVTVPALLEREGVIAEKALAELLATRLRLKLIDLGSWRPSTQVTRALKESVATQYEVLPVRVDEHTVEVATANPLDMEALKAVEFATGRRVHVAVATRAEVRTALAHAYRVQESLEVFLEQAPDGPLTELQDDSLDLHTITREGDLPPVIKLADLVLIEAIKAGASDVHIEPSTDAVVVRYRIDGILEEGFRFPKWVQAALVSRVKVMAKLDIMERRVPQDGRMQVRYQEKLVDVRISSLPMRHGEKIALRMIDPSYAINSLDRLGLGAADRQRLRDAVKRPQGMVLVTGPTGSGKTTTLYALIREIFSPGLNIVTIENPIECQLKGINQVEINEKQGLTFPSVLRSILRQDPDVILVGEIRDEETARIAVQAAQTGHLVLSTLHTNDVAATVTRLLDLGIEPYALTSSLNLIVAQRLVRQVCGACSATCTPPDDTLRLLRLDARGGEFRRGLGCPACRQTGYAGRMGVYEVVPISKGIAKVLEAGGVESALRAQASTEGYGTLLHDALGKVTAGVTTPDEVLRVVQLPEDGFRCPACQQDVTEEYAACPYCSTTLRRMCGSCGKSVNPDWVTCPHCRARVNGPDGAAAVAMDGEPPHALPEAGPSPAEHQRRTFTALVADDDPDVRSIVHQMLEESALGLTVISARDGKEALALAALHRPDIVILDVSMPGIDGFEVCGRLRADVRSAFVPILILTADDSADGITRGFALGTDDYLAKPFRREELIARVGRMLERTYAKDAVGRRSTVSRRKVSRAVDADSHLELVSPRRSNS